MVRGLRHIHSSDNTNNISPAQQQPEHRHPPRQPFSLTTPWQNPLRRGRKGRVVQFAPAVLLRSRSPLSFTSPFGKGCLKTKYNHRPTVRSHSLSELLGTQKKKKKKGQGQVSLPFPQSFRQTSARLLTESGQEVIGETYLRKRGEMRRGDALFCSWEAEMFSFIAPARSFHMPCKEGVAVRAVGMQLKSRVEGQQ